MGKDGEEADIIGKSYFLKVDDDDLWVLGEVTKQVGGKVHLVRDHVPDKTIDKKVQLTDAEFAKCKEAAGGDVAEAIKQEDLCTLADPYDHTFVHVLRTRYEKEIIYTAVGAVMLAINPYRKVASCSPQNLAELTRMDPEDLPAHGFKIASEAYRGMTGDGGGGEAQSILVSGESGAGKTETAKLMIACLALISHSSGTVVEAALESGLLLEAFGNARTVYNNNSSRFGKWLAVQFDPRGKMASCQLLVFLLELSRISFVGEGERNYHIFYFMLEGASPELRAQWQLKEDYKKYTYLNKGEKSSPGIDDAKEWDDTYKRMSSLGFEGIELRNELFKLIAAVLTLGNVTFRKTKDAGTQDIYETEPTILAQVASLLSVDAAALDKRLTSKTVIVQGNPLDVFLSEEGCMDSKDALAKTVYLAIFDHIVARANDTLSGGTGGATLHAGEADPASIGLLDIFGFENFRMNTFEQLCINFTNEVLQKFFMDTLIRRERTEYDRENIKCDDIAYPDNSAQVDLLDHKKQGVFAMLDEACRAPSGSDEKYVSSMINAFTGKKYEKLFSKPQFGAKAIGVDLGPEMAKKQFVVKHFAEDVLYTAHNWLEKNRGKLHPDLAAVIAGSESVLLAEVIPPPEDTSSKGPTVSGAFRKSLSSLAATMTVTHQHFIRCIKPNQQKVPFRLEGLNVIRQLRYLGVPAVVEINRAGWPVKQTFEDFKRKYRCIAFDEPALIKESLPMSEQCINLLRKGGLPRDGPNGWDKTREVQIGKTKVFLKPAMVHILDIPRREARRKAGIAVQAYARRRVARNITKFARVHALGAMAVRKVINRQEKDAKIATVKARITDTGLVLDNLLQATENSPLPATIAPVIVRAHATNEKLENELRTLAQDLEQEEIAYLALKDVVENNKGAQKEAFLALKTAVNNAVEASNNVTSELRHLIKSVKDEVEERFQAMLTDWEAELKRQAELREAARRIEARDHAVTVRQSLDTATGEAAGAMKMLTIKITNGLDSKSTSGELALGFSATLGVNFDDLNMCSRLVPVGTVATDGKLQLGDVVLSVDGVDLDGRKPGDVIEELQKPSVTLEVARSVEEGKKDDGELPEGEYSSWLQMQQAKFLFIGGLTASSPVHKTWAAISDGQLLLFVEKVRGQPLSKMTFPLEGCVVKTPPKSANPNKKAPGVEEGSKPPKRLDSAEIMKQQVDKGTKLANDVVGGTIQTTFGDEDEAQAAEDKKKGKKPPPKKGKNTKSVTGDADAEKGKAMEALIARGLLPFRLSWPDDKKSPVIILCVQEGAERKGWTKALNAAIKLQNLQKPTFGFLHKKQGRNGGFLAAFKSGWNKHYFKLLQATFVDGQQATSASFVYYKGETEPAPGDAPKGIILLNKDASLVSALSLGSAVTDVKQHAFGITTVEEENGVQKKVTTTLAADRSHDLENWVAAVELAINSFKPKSQQTSASDNADASKEEAALHKKTLLQLKMTLEYMNVKFDHSTTDKAVLVQAIMRQKKINNLKKNAHVHEELDIIKHLSKEEERLMHRTVDELKSLLGFLEVEYDDNIQTVEPLVRLVIKQRHLEHAALAAQGILRLKKVIAMKKAVNRVIRTTNEISAFKKKEAAEQ